jgi:hypothetical protein
MQRFLRSMKDPSAGPSGPAGGASETALGGRPGGVDTRLQAHALVTVTRFPGQSLLRALIRRVGRFVAASSGELGLGR